MIPTAISSRPRVVVTGILAQYPLGGLTWHYLNYVLGFLHAGCDVYYVEDSGGWPYNPREGGLALDWTYNATYIDEVMRAFGLADRWAYRLHVDPPRWLGLPDARRREVLRTAELLVNVSGSLAFPEEYRGIRRLAYVDTDPVFTQLKLAAGDADSQRLIDAHDVHFTFGERVGEHVPAAGYHWIPTRQPVALAAWEPAPAHRGVLTTVMNWTSYHSVEHEGVQYGQKDVEFERFIELPSRVAPTVLELAVNAGKTTPTPRQRLVQHGWRLVDPALVCPDPVAYRDYVRSSRGEWSVAKNAYVRAVSGWFSERSACYLAAGRPVIAQDTGFSGILPTGAGLLAFRTLDEAAAAVERVVVDHRRHALAARRIAEEYFDAAMVLGRLVESAFASGTTDEARPRVAG